MKQPSNIEEYTEKFLGNQKIFGYGMDTSQSLPCPFCAAPDFMIFKIMDCKEEMTKNHTCLNCGRSSKTIFTESSGSVNLEIVQTGGEDQPEWLVPKIRRVEG